MRYSPPLEGDTCVSNREFAFSHPKIRQLLAENLVSDAEVLALLPTRWALLCCDWIVQKLQRGYLCAEELAGLSNAVTAALTDTGVQALIDQGVVQLANLLGTALPCLTILCCPAVQALLFAGRLRFTQLQRLNWAACDVLEDPEVCALLMHEVITVRELYGLSAATCIALTDAEVRQLLVDGVLTMAQLRRLTPLACVSIRDPLIHQQLRLSLLTFEELLLQERHLEVNPSQSTHHRSVHHSVAMSTDRLMWRYGALLAGEGLANTLQALMEWMLAVTQHGVQSEIVLRGFRYVFVEQAEYLHPEARISMQELLALVYLAIHDDSLRMGSLEEAQQQLLVGFYEIQRGYNLSATGEDDGINDDTICATGAFHKLLEKLQGVHPDVELVFMDLTTAALKLQVLVREEVTLYLRQQLQYLQTAPQALCFVYQLTVCMQQGLGQVWPKIQYPVGTRLYAEFHFLFRRPNNPVFTGLLEQGQAADLPDWKVFQQPLQQTAGYRHYVSRLMISSHHLSKSPLVRRVFSRHEKIQLQLNIKGLYATARKFKSA